MLFNAIGWAMEDEALTPVRTKTLDRAPDPGRIARAPPSASSCSTSPAFPLAFVVFGVVRWRLRRARRQGLKL